MGLVLARGQRRRVQVARLGPVKLNLDDLEDLRILLNTKTGEATHIEAGRYDASAVSDLADADDEDLTSVVISVPASSFTVSLLADGANVVCDSDDRALFDLVEDVANFVNGKPMSRRIVYPPALMVVFILQWLLIVGCATFLMSTDARTTGYWCSGILTAVYVAAYWFEPRRWKARGAVEIVPLRRHELRRRRFDSRNSTWSGVIGAIAGALLGAGATIGAVYLGK